MIAAIPRPTCQTCDGTFDPGEEVYASDWKVFDLNGGGRWVVKYNHVRCVDGEQVAS